MGSKNKFSDLITVGSVVKEIEREVPAGLQESWDNSGIQIGFEDAPVRKILTCLELNHKVAEEAADAGANMIVTHHPLIFGALRSFSTSDYKGRMIMELISSGISVYSCHTPFDKVKGGNNDIVAEKLGLVSVGNLRGEDVGAPDYMLKNSDEADIGRIGSFSSPISLREAAEIVSRELQLSLSQLKVVGNSESEISNVGICTGAGADLMQMAAAAGCELFITGDVKYHEAQTARELGLCIIDAGHYGTEKFFGCTMKNLLDRLMGGKVEIISSCVDIDPFNLIY